MAKLDGLDGLCNIEERHIYCLVNALDYYNRNDLSSKAIEKGWSKSDMLQALAASIHSIQNEYKRSFVFNDPLTLAYTKNGKKASPAIATYVVTMGLAWDESRNFELSSLGEKILNFELSISSYALILLSKVGVYVDNDRKTNLLTAVCRYALDNPDMQFNKELVNDVVKHINENAYVDSRDDIAFNALVLSGIISLTSNETYVINPQYIRLVEYIVLNGENISSPNSVERGYMGGINKGILEIISQDTASLFLPMYNDLVRIKLDANLRLNLVEKPSESHQIIYYGAPGTGKSHKIKEMLGEYDGCPEEKKVPKQNIFRTTFHPDSDYSTFVGAYKPTKDKKPLYGLFGDKTIRFNDGGDLSEEVITYKFTPQAFLKAYIRAYQVPTENVYLVIEEINRGNCAQIFGDLFQLLDRDPSGKSDYTIKADDDMRTFLEDEFKNLGVGDDGIKDGELCLPSNLYIYATMNTSDQSLFPIDSAFKRRWDWEYEPIKYKNTGWTIKIDDDHQYKWVEFQNEVNFRILRDTGSEDKMLGDYFVNPGDGIITKSMLLNKILFYLWNDVCKDGDGEIFKTNGSTEVTFSELFGNDAKLIAMLDYLQSEYKKRNPSKEETPTATDVEAEQEPLD